MTVPILQGHSGVGGEGSRTPSGGTSGCVFGGGAAQSCAVHTVLCSPSQTPPGCEIRTFHRHHHPRDVRHGPPPAPSPAHVSGFSRRLPDEPTISPSVQKAWPRKSCREQGQRHGPIPIPTPVTPSHRSSATLTCLERSGLLESTSYLWDEWERGHGAEWGWGEGRGWDGNGDRDGRGMGDQRGWKQRMGIGNRKQGWGRWWETGMGNKDGNGERGWELGTGNRGGDGNGGGRHGRAGTAGSTHRSKRRFCFSSKK